MIPEFGVKSCDSIIDRQICKLIYFIVYYLEFFVIVWLCLFYYDNKIAYNTILVWQMKILLDDMQFSAR